jgi:hypothetical protein
MSAWKIVAAFALASGAGPAPARAQQGAPAAPQADAAAAAAFHAEIARLYRVEGGALQQRGGVEAVSGTLDGFWNRVKADRAAYLPLLRAELVRTDNPAFFYFDGAQLLREASDSRSDGELALGVIERADLAYVDPSGYLIALNWYVNHGYDTRRAALRLLDQPRQEIEVALMPHMFHYTTLEATIFSLFGMDEHRFVGDLIARAQTAHDDFEIMVLLHCIWATATPEGRAALAAYADDSSKTEPARRYAREMLTHRSDTARPRARPNCARRGGR